MNLFSTEVKSRRKALSRRMQLGGIGQSLHEVVVKAEFDDGIGFELDLFVRRVA